MLIYVYLNAVINLKKTTAVNEMKTKSELFVSIVFCNNKDYCNKYSMLGLFENNYNFELTS